MRIVDRRFRLACLVAVSLVAVLTLSGCGTYKTVPLTQDLVGKDVRIVTDDEFMYDVTVYSLDRFELLAESDEVEELVSFPLDEIFEVLIRQTDPLLTGVAVGGGVCCAIIFAMLMCAGD